MNKIDNNLQDLENEQVPFPQSKLVGLTLLITGALSIPFLVVGAFTNSFTLSESKLEPSEISDNVYYSESDTVNNDKRPNETMELVVVPFEEYEEDFQSSIKDEKVEVVKPKEPVKNEKVKDEKVEVVKPEEPVKDDVNDDVKEDVTDDVKDAKTEEPTKEETLKNPLPKTYDDMLKLDLTQPSGIPQEFWESYLSKSFKHLAPILPTFDEDGINSAWILAVIYTEVGRNANVVGKYNYFNFTVDTKSYTNFSSPEACMDYAKKWIKESYFNRDWHKTRPAGYCKWHSDEPITVERVNEHYAINPDMSVNWRWTEVVCELMVDIYSKYSQWASV